MERADPNDGDETADDSRDDDLKALNMERLVALASMMEAEAMVIVESELESVGVTSGVLSIFRSDQSYRLNTSGP